MKRFNQVKKDMMISVICPYNDKSLFDAMLLPSIKNQSYKNYEIIAIDSKKMKFSSAAKALNYGYSISKGEILVFTHQDIELNDESVFQKIIDFCNANEFGIAGVAGVDEKKHQVFSSITQGINKEQVGCKVEKAISVDSLDECFFFIKKNKFHMFTDLGDTWHLYAVDYCINCKIRKEKIYIVPLNIYHGSPGWSLNNNYWMTLKKIGKKYRGKIMSIPTTLGIYPNNVFLNFKILYKKLYIDLIRKKSFRKNCD